VVDAHRAPEGAALSAPAERRPVGALQLLAVAVSGVVGVGIFFAPSELAKNAPGWGSLAVLGLTGIALLPVAAAFANAGRRFDEDGGPVVFARAAFGPFAAFLVGWIAYVSAVASTTAVTSGLTAAIAPGLGVPAGLPTRLAAVALVSMLALLVALGLRLSARIWTTLTVVKLVPLVALVAAFAFAGFPVLADPGATAPSLHWLRAGLLATFAFQGFEIAPVIAGQVEKSSHAIPIALYGTLALVSVLYIALQAACVAALPGLAGSSAPLADAALAIAGPGLSRLVAAGTSVSALGITFGMVVMTPRYLSALAAGERLPFSFERLSPVGVPLRALFLTWLLVSILLLAGGELSQFFALSGTTVLLQYGVTALALFALARRGVNGFVAKDAWPALPALVVTLALVSGAEAREAITAALAIGLGLLLRRAGGAAALREP
jgi:amino acid transporter